MRNELEVMRIVRVPPMGKLVVQVGNRRLESLVAVEDESVRRRLVTAIGELIVFAGGYQELVDLGVTPPLPTRVGDDGGRPAAGAEEGTLTPEQAAFLSSLEADLQATIEGSPPQAPEVDNVQVQLDNPPRPSGSPNLVAEIDAILQRHLAQDPALRHRYIHLEQPPTGILQIRVDNSVYEHPQEIEDDKVRGVIKKALQEWESR